MYSFNQTGRLITLGGLRGGLSEDALHNKWLTSLEDQRFESQELNRSGPGDVLQSRKSVEAARPLSMQRLQETTC